MAANYSADVLFPFVNVLKRAVPKNVYSSFVFSSPLNLNVALISKSTHVLVIFSVSQSTDKTMHIRIDCFTVFKFCIFKTPEYKNSHPVQSNAILN